MLEQVRVTPGTAAGLSGRDPGDTLGLAGKDEAHARRDRNAQALATYQPLLWAEKERAVLLILQGMDGAGKDSTIRRVFVGLNPQGCRVVSFGKPAGEETEHNYLWRIARSVPRRGEIGIFNRSHYEDVAVVRVAKLVDESRWRPRYRHIREFERMLVDEGTVVVKVYLHISPEEQRQRLQERLDDPAKHWKFNPEDLRARSQWNDYQAAYEEALTETSTDHAPWHVVPADRKWVRDVVVTQLLVEALQTIDPQPPPAPPGLDGLVVT